MVPLSAFSVKRVEVVRDSVEIFFVQMHRGHQGARFEVSRIVDEGTQVVRRIRHRTGGDGGSAGEMGEIRAEGAFGCRARDGVAVDARVGLKDGAPVGSGGKLRGVFLLLRDPCGKGRWRIRIDADEHFGVLGSAVLRALAEIEAGLGGVNPHGIDLIWNQIHFAGEARDPEAMVGIGRGHSEIGQGRMHSIANGYMEFVCSDDAELGIAVLPPELMTYDNDIECVGWLGCGLVDEDDAGGGEKKNHDDDDGQNGPGELNLRAAVDLGRFALRVAAAMPVADERVEQQPTNDEKDAAADCEHEQGKIEDGMRRSCGRSENRGRRLIENEGQEGTRGAPEERLYGTKVAAPGMKDGVEA